MVWLIFTFFFFNYNVSSESFNMNTSQHFKIHFSQSQAHSLPLFSNSKEKQTLYLVGKSNLSPRMTKKSLFGNVHLNKKFSISLFYICSPSQSWSVFSAGTCEAAGPVCLSAKHTPLSWSRCTIAVRNKNKQKRIAKLSQNQLSDGLCFLTHWTSF